MLFGWITPAFAGAGAGFDAVRPQPAGRPEAVAPRLEGDRYPVDGAAGLLSLLAPAMQPQQQPCLAWFELLCRVPLDPRNNAGDEPARLAHLDHRDQCVILVESGERLLMSFSCGMGTPSVVCSDDDAFLSPLAP